MKRVFETPESCFHRAAGGVVVSDLSPEASVAVLHRTDGEWTLPKGHLEGDESPREAALREIEEEVGLRDLKIIADLETIRYTFHESKDPKPHQKEVVFYLALSPAGVCPLEIEDNPKFKEAIWLPLPEAERLCTYPTVRAVLRKARDFLERPSGDQIP